MPCYLQTRFLKWPESSSLPNQAIISWTFSRSLQGVPSELRLTFQALKRCLLDTQGKCYSKHNIMYYSGINRDHNIEDWAFHSREREPNVIPTPNEKNPFSAFVPGFETKCCECNISTSRAPIRKKLPPNESWSIQAQHIKKSAIQLSWFEFYDTKRERGRKSGFPDFTRPHKKGERSGENLEAGPTSQKWPFLGERGVLERKRFSWTLGQMFRLSNAVFCFNLECAVWSLWAPKAVSIRVIHPVTCVELKRMQIKYRHYIYKEE